MSSAVPESENDVEPPKRPIGRKRAKAVKHDGPKPKIPIGAADELAVAITKLASSSAAKVQIASDAAAAASQASDDKLMFHTPSEDLDEIQMEYLLARRKQVMERFRAREQQGVRFFSHSYQFFGQ